MTQKMFAIFAALFIGFNAHALPMPRLSDNRNFILPNDQYHFDGIVGLSNCSGSIIRFVNSKTTDPAMILTNGHCLEEGMPKANTFHYRERSNRTFEIFNDQARIIGTLHAVGILYATMTLTDITLYQLQETYQNIFDAYKVHPFLLSPKHPTATTPIQIISGFWKRGYSCSIDGFVNELREADWSWRDSVRYSRPGCEVIGGTSGSPVINPSTREVIAVNNTVNEKGTLCTLNDPCEVDRDGRITSIPGNAYAQETYQIYTCVNATNQFDLATPGCQLFH